MSQLCVDRKLLPVKIHYFLFYAALACALPFRTVLAKQLGISATAVGVIFCALPFFKTVTNPVFGVILDYFKRFRLMISVSVVFLSVFHVAMILIPSRASVSHNMIDIGENNSHSQLRYLCLKDFTSSVCHPKFILYSEFRVYNNYIKEGNSFICDMKCFKPVNIAVDDKGIGRRCTEKLKFEFVVLVNISNCDTSVLLESGQLTFSHNNVHNSLPINMSGSFIKEIKSSSLPFENCSVRLNQSSTSNMYGKPERISNDRNQTTEEDILKHSDYAKHYGFTDIPESLDDRVKQYYVLKEYEINFFRDTFYMNNSCILELDCQMNNCHLNTGQDESNLETAEENEFLCGQFWGLALLIVSSSITLSAIIFMMDAVCYELLQDKRDKYGQQRLWGTIGWGVGALAGGYLNQVATANSEEVDYVPSFCLLAIILLIDLVPVNQLKVKNIKYSSHIWKDVCFLLSKIEILCSIAIVYVVGVLSGFIWNYQFWFMEEIGSSQVLLGLSQAFEALFEIPWFVVSGWIIKKIGHDHCNNITLFCFGLRYLCFAFMYDPWWTLAAGLFHGPTFGLFYASMTMFAKNNAPPGTEATVQSLLYLSFEGLGVATGSLLGGVGIDKFGSRTSFLYAAELSFLFLLVNIVMVATISRTKKNPKKIGDTSTLWVVKKFMRFA